MKVPEGFYTQKGYLIHTNADLTASMEDYLEMICRIFQENGCVRACDLSKMLHVRPSSVTKMIQHLSLSGYLLSEKYGIIRLTEKGREEGRYLLYRHDVIHRFLCALNHSDNELEQVEKIEHFLNRETVENLERLIWKLETAFTYEETDKPTRQEFSPPQAPSQDYTSFYSDPE